ncbi:MAG: 3-dehydroquinate synthase family protein [Archangium sp.]
MIPGAYVKCRDVYGRFDELMARLPDGPVLVIADERVLRLHPHVKKALRDVKVLSLRAGESAKSLKVVERLTTQALAMPRSLTLLAIGGGTIGDVATVFAHTFKRGVKKFIQVPTTLLAAVDSSVGGKGAVNVGGAKNVVGVFHSAEEAWLCPELFETLSESQRREGRLEAWKMVVTLDARRFAQWEKSTPDDPELIRVSRELKHSLVAKDPYETKGLRVALNFGHTMGHVIESLSKYRVRHGEAVGLGMLFALDEGVRRGVTSPELRSRIEAVLPNSANARRELAKWTSPKFAKQTAKLLAADKKGAWILLSEVGKWRSLPMRQRGEAQGGGPLSPTLSPLRMEREPLVPPLSKSDAQRALVLADILGVEVDLPNDALPRDVEVLRAGLLALRKSKATIDCRDGGAPYRFLLGQAAVLPNRRVTFTGTERLGERPHEPLIDALRSLPIELTTGTPWPVTVTTHELAKNVRFTVTGVESSQFASSLLLAAARLAHATGEKVDVNVNGALTSEGYFTLTKSWLTRAGFSTSPVRAPRIPKPLPQVPGDWSSLGYLLALSWVSGLRIERLERNTGHPDEAIVMHLELIGLKVTDRLEGTARRGFDVDSETCPDAIPTLAVIATVLPKPSSFRRIGILRHKESDRAAGIIELLATAGITARIKGDTLTVTPGTAKPFTFDPHDDHRLAMSAAVLGRLHHVKATITNRDCVAKSFPGFWTEAAKAGVKP